MAYVRRRLLVVDGYNVLRSGSRYVDAPKPDWTDDYFNAAREMLLKDVINFAGRNTQAAIVYDGAGSGRKVASEETVGGVRVIFSPAGQSADKLIEKMAYDARERGIEVTVVSSDARIQETVFGGGVDRMSAEGFSRAAAVEDVARAEDAHPARTSKNTIAGRVSAETVEKLRALRDNL
jgi:predicted RNA-binding protein with PIN domain